MAAYYNEFDPFAADWLRELIKRGLIADGEVDERSISDIDARDLAGFRQCHFFAGIGGWSYALRLAGWSDDRHVWTGSCPCQPFSVAGKQRGVHDERHLWPVFFDLISQCRPAIVFGEQVASRDGRQWLAGICADLERLAYAVAGADLCAAGVGAPHIRQRLFWVAHADSARSQGFRPYGDPSGWRGSNMATVGLCGRARDDGRLADAHDAERRENGAAWNDSDRDDAGRQKATGDNGTRRFWDDAEWRVGADGKARRVKPGVFLLVDGPAARMGRLRGFGNAIVPQAAAAFVKALEGAI